MIQSLIVITLVVIALLFWLHRLFPVHAARLKARLGIARQTAPDSAPKNGCDGCNGCKGGDCH